MSFMGLGFVFKSRDTRGMQVLLELESSRLGDLLISGPQDLENVVSIRSRRVCRAWDG